MLIKLRVFLFKYVKKAVDRDYASMVTNKLSELPEDELREIRLLDPQYVKLFIEEYENLMRETSI